MKQITHEYLVENGLILLRQLLVHKLMVLKHQKVI
jgi:hypothetical protein